MVLILHFNNNSMSIFLILEKRGVKLSIHLVLKRKAKNCIFDSIYDFFILQFVNTPHLP